MELKVWVEGIQKVVCGVTAETTCQDVIYALAYATGKTGRFTLIEKWRSNERLLAPHENPLKILMKWGEYSNEVQFILHWSDFEVNKKKFTNNILFSNQIQNSSELITPSNTNYNILRDINKFLNLSESRSLELLPSGSKRLRRDNIGIVKGIPQKPLNDIKKKIDCDEDQYISESKEFSNLMRPSHPPPYRPPPPVPSNTDCQLQLNNENKIKQIINKTECTLDVNKKENMTSLNKVQDTVYLNSYDNIKNPQSLQKINLPYSFANPSADIASYTRLEILANEHEKELFQLELLEQEHQLSLKWEQQVQVELSVLHERLNSCENQLSQCCSQMRTLLEAVKEEQISQDEDLNSEVQNLLQKIAESKLLNENAQIVSEKLAQEIAFVEMEMREKQKLINDLITAIKSENLKGLNISYEELHNTFIGFQKRNKPRKILGSPRLLENAAPTTKNPYGVWV